MVLTVASLTFGDSVRRGPVWAVVALVAVLMLSLRYLSLFAFGEETKLLLELGVTNLLAGGALLAVLAAAPVSKLAAVSAADRVLLTRPTHRLLIPVGRWMGVIGVVIVGYVVWIITLAIALSWFASSERSIFLLDGQTTVLDELRRLIGPVALALLHSLVMCAAAIAASARASFLATFAVVGGVMIAGVALPSFAQGTAAEPLFSAILPDLTLHQPGAALYAERVSAAWLGGAAIQAFAVALLLLMVGSWMQRPQ